MVKNQNKTTINWYISIYNLISYLNNFSTTYFYQRIECLCNNKNAVSPNSKLLLIKLGTAMDDFSFSIRPQDIRLCMQTELVNKPVRVWFLVKMWPGLVVSWQTSWFFPSVVSIGCHANVNNIIPPDWSWRACVSMPLLIFLRLPIDTSWMRRLFIWKWDW